MINCGLVVYNRTIQIILRTMFTFQILLILIVISVFFAFIEFFRHQKRIYSIPIRIHINGTRGKSSVARLIGAGLSENGILTMTKVTGTFPRLILEDGSEVRIYRKADANIIEQLNIVKYAVQRKVEALVIECMALEPSYQWLTENQMIHATVGAITNVRMDHLDVMGRTLPEIADALGNTIPKNNYLFTAENDHPKLLEELSLKKNTKIKLSRPETISNEEMEGFTYIEHKENVALALDICTHLGVDRPTALKGMYRAEPDPGSLRRYSVHNFGKHINFYNAFAANDPHSTMMIWNMLKNDLGINESVIILLNTRHDRLDRAKQLAEMVGAKMNDEIDFLMLMGESTDVVESMSRDYGTDKRKIVNIGFKEPNEIFEKIISLTAKTSTVLAIGNMGGKGAALAEYFESRSVELIND